MLDEQLIEIYVEEYRVEFAKRTRELNREGDRLKKRHGDAVAKIERLVEAVANGAEDFVEIRDVLTKARTDRDQLAEQIAQLQQLPKIALHPDIVAEYRRQVAKLNAALNANPEARLEAIPQLRALMDQVKVSPAAQEKGVTIEVIGRLTSIMAIATNQPVSEKQYFNVGAGEGIRTLDPNLGNRQIALLYYRMQMQNRLAACLRNIMRYHDTPLHRRLMLPQMLPSIIFRLWSHIYFRTMMRLDETACHRIGERTA